MVIPTHPTSPLHTNAHTHTPASQWAFGPCSVVKALSASARALRMHWHWLPKWTRPTILCKINTNRKRCSYQLKQCGYVCMYIHTHMHAHTRTHTHTCMHTHAHTHTHTCMHTHAHTHTHACTHRPAVPSSLAPMQWLSMSELSKSKGVQPSLSLAYKSAPSFNKSKMEWSITSDSVSECMQTRCTSPIMRYKDTCSSNTTHFHSKIHIVHSKQCLGYPIQLLHSLLYIRMYGSW